MYGVIFKHVHLYFFDNLKTRFVVLLQVNKGSHQREQQENFKLCVLRYELSFIGCPDKITSSSACLYKMFNHFLIFGFLRMDSKAL